MEKVAALIIIGLNNGLTIQEAFDRACGAGSYDALIHDVYTTLRTHHKQAA